jgi:hemoglobin
MKALAMPDASSARSQLQTAMAAPTALIALASAFVLQLAPACPAFAQAAAPAAQAASAPLVPHYASDPALLAAFGGKDGLFKLAAVFVDKMRADPVIGHYFEKTKLPLLKTQLGDQLCQLLAGPCVYDGDSMKASHADLKITKADSFRQVEVLQSSMDELGIPFRVQNQLLARLAPMYREIITR